MQKLAAALLVAVALAGCSGKGAGDEPSDASGMPGAGHGGHGADDPATHLVAPAWQVGRWWTLNSEQAAAPFTHVVSGDAGADWVMDTDSPEIAFFDARFDISFLGQVRKSDLAGSQGSDRVKFFDFPLTEGKQWTTTWDGLAMTVKAVSVEGGVARVEARHANGTLYAAYSYDAKAGYFRDYAFYAPDGVTVGFAARLAASGANFTGDLVRQSLETKYEHHGAIPTGQFSSFPVDATVTDVWVDVHIACEAGAFSVTVGPPSAVQTQRGFTASGPCPSQVDETGTVTAPTEPNESWGVVVNGAPPAQGTLDLTVITRTATTFKAGAAP